MSLNTISTVAGIPGASGFAGDGGPAKSARLCIPYALRPVPRQLYIADTVNARVRRVSPAGIITTFAGNGSDAASGDGGPATAAAHPSWSCAVGPDGSVYITDENQRIRRVGLDGIITTVAGTGMNGFSGDGGPAVAANLDSRKQVGRRTGR